MIKAFGILLGFQAAGNILAVVTGMPIPGNVAGMMLLMFFLVAEIISVDHVEPAAQLLIDNLAFLFVPAGVGIMSYFEVLAAEWLPLSLSILVSLLAVLIVTGKLAGLLRPEKSDGACENG